MNPHLTIIAKAPVPGRVKTRLCPPCSPDQAAALAAAALADTVDAVDRLAMSCAFRKVLLIDGEAPGWLPLDYEVVDQSAGDLGDRMAAGYARLGAGVMVGMETPHAVSTLVAAFAAIERGVDTLAPALDGGYWAIGLARTDPAIFDGVEMSTESTGRRQLARMRELGRNVELLAHARDIDTFDDVRALAETGGWGRAVALAVRLVDELATSTN